MKNNISEIKSLESYNTSDFKIFHGREESTELALEIFKRNKILTVNGAQSTGKSSFVKCSIFNRLKNKFSGINGNDWKICSFRPGLNPIENFCTALSTSDLLYKNSKPKSSDFDDYLEIFKQHEGFGLLEIFKNSEINNHKNLLIHIDQFEDLFKYPKFYNSDNNSDDDLFIDIINKTIRNKNCPIYFILTIETSFLTKLNSYGTFSELLSLSQYNLPNLNFENFYNQIKSKLNFKIDNKIIDGVKQRILEKPSLISNFQFLINSLQEKSNDKKLEINENNFNVNQDLKLAIGKEFDEYHESQSTENQKIIEKIFRSLINCDIDNNKIFYQRFDYIKNYTGLSSKILSKFIVEFNKDFGFVLDNIGFNISPIKSKYKFEFSDETIISLKNSETFHSIKFKNWQKDEFKNYEYVNEIIKFKIENKKLDSIEIKKSNAFLINHLINKLWLNKYDLNFDEISKYILEQKKIFELEIIEKEYQFVKKQKDRKLTNYIALLFFVGVLLVLFWLGTERVRLKDYESKFNNTDKELLTFTKKYDSIEKRIKKLNVKLEKEQESLRLSQNIIKEKEDEIIKNNKQLVFDQIKIDSQITQIKKNKQQINSANLEIDISKSFIELTSNEIKLNNDIKSLTREIYLLGDNEKQKLLQFSKMSLFYAKEFARIQLTKDSLINLYKERFKNDKSLTISNTNNDLNNLRKLAFLNLSKLNNVKHITEIKENNLLNKTYNKNIEPHIKEIIITDDNRLIFIGESNKIYFTDLNKSDLISSEFESISLDDKINTISEIDSDLIFAGLNNGELWYLSLNSNEKVKIYPKKRSKNKFQINSIVTAKNKIFFANNDELLSYDPVTKKLNEILIEETKNDIINDIIYDNKETLFFVTEKGNIYDYNIVNNRHSLLLESYDNELFSKKDKVTKLVLFGDKLIFSTIDGWIYIFYRNLKSKQIIFEQRILAHDTEIKSILYDKENSKLVSSANDGSLCIFSLDNLASLGERRIDLDFGIKNKINDIGIIKDNSKNLIVLADNSGNLSLIDLDLKNIFEKINIKINQQ